MNFAFNELLALNVINIIVAVVILIVGWIVALIISSGVGGALRRTGVSKRLAKWFQDEEGQPIGDVSRWISKAVFYVVMLFVLVAFFQYLELAIVAEPFSQFLTQIFNYLPMLAGGLVLLFVAWAVASLLRVITHRALVAIKIDEKFGEQVEIEKEKQLPLSQLISKAAYWLVLLLFLPAILTALRLEGLLQPVQSMTDRALVFLPNILAAVLILVAGWFLARLLQRLSRGLLITVGLDNLSERVGLAQVMGRQQLSHLISLVIYALVLIVTIIAALNAVALEAITQPASNMLNMILAALPAIFAASLVLLIAYAVARVVKGLLANLLRALGFDAILARLGLTREEAEGKWTPSETTGYIALVVIMLFAVIEAASLLGFVLLADLVTQLLVFLSHVILALIIFGIGLYLANLAYKAIKVSDTSQAELLGKVARYAIIVFAGTMALQRMGLADEIILLAFGLFLGTLAISTILALGLGGKDIVARELDEWVKKRKADSSE